MKKQLYTAFHLMTLLAVSVSTANASSNTGYTTAANVYSGSSSHSWFGGGVAHVLAQWRKEADAPTEQEATPEETTKTIPEVTNTTPKRTNTATSEIATSFTTELRPSKSLLPPTGPFMNE